MIHTKQPANQFYVFLSAYRSHESQEVNEKMTKGLIAEVRKFPGTYGVIEHENVQGCFKEAGAESASIERTIKVRARNIAEVEALTYLACKVHNQDAVLIVNSQTHTTSLGLIEERGEYPLTYPVLAQQALGVFTKQDTASEHYSIIDGERWEVAA